MKYDGFKAKPAVLTLIGSVIGSGGASGQGALKSLVPCLVGFLSSEDWAARKAAAEALAKLAVVERDTLSEFKAGSLRTFENRKFDKVIFVLPFSKYNFLLYFSFCLFCQCAVIGERC